jgi:hypothetical protein
MALSKKRLLIKIATAVILILAAGFILYKLIFPDEFKVSEDEIALRIRLDTAEDIGLLVYDYNINGEDYSGGVSNADRSLIGHDEEIIVTWNEEELHTDLKEENDITVTFRVITEYTDPNFDNVYPEEITMHLDPVEWTAHKGEEYTIRITGDNTNGYEVTME